MAGPWEKYAAPPQESGPWSKYAQPEPQGDTLELAQEPGTLELLGKGFKSGIKGVGQGIGQAIGVTSAEDVARSRAEDQPVLDTTAGTIGHAVGTMAGYLPAAFIPGANTLAGGAILGAGIGAIQPHVNTNEALTNVAFGGVGGLVGGKISQLLAAREARRAARAAQATPNVVAKNQALDQFHQSNYAVPPQDAGAGALSQLLNALSGKIKTEQKVSVNNQPITNAKAARSIGLPEHEPITLDAIDSARKQAGKAYDAVRSAGTIKTDNQFQADLAGIVQKFQSAANDFPELLNTDVTKIVNSVNKPQFDADSAIDAIKILRDKGTKAFRDGDQDVARAYKKSADALEDTIGRSLARSGASPDLVKNFREARELYAKTFTVEKALNTGSNNVNAGKIAKELGKGKLTGELEEIAKFAKAYPRANQELAGANPFSVFDAGVAGIGGGLVNPAIAAGVAARPIVRSMILSPTYQKMFVKGAMPNAKTGSVMLLRNKAAMPLSALGAIKGGQE